MSCVLEFMILGMIGFGLYLDSMEYNPNLIQRFDPMS